MSPPWPLETSLDGQAMQGRDMSSWRNNWAKPAKGDNPNRKSYVLQGSGGWAQGQQPRLGKFDMLKILDRGMKGR